MSFYRWVSTQRATRRGDRTKAHCTLSLQEHYGIYQTLLELNNKFFIFVHWFAPSVLVAPEVFKLICALNVYNHVPQVDYLLKADMADMMRYTKTTVATVTFYRSYTACLNMCGRERCHKKSEEMISAFRDIFGDCRKPARMRTDKGSEFVQ